ncbi:hypothetical protein TrVGV298_010677 [Trichoderma virens]|nr:hypothetical protein TrVGV298_010677 [Trichoderma virens]
MRVTRSSVRKSAIEIENRVANLRKHQKFVEYAIPELYKLGAKIREASAVSLIPRMEAYSAKRSDSYLEDIAFSKVKTLYPKAPLSLQRLLGRSIVARYFSIQSRGKDQRRLSTHRILTLDEEDKPRAHNDPELLNLISGKDCIDDALTVARDDSATKIDAVLSKSESSASIFQADEFQSEPEERRQHPALSSVSGTPSVPLDHISYPEPPKPLGDGKSSWATCCWCSETYPYHKFEDKNWWRHHVDHDLRPYVCLVDTCSKSGDTFDGFSSWTAHMERHHSPNWISIINTKVMWECDVDTHSEFFDDEASLRNHMMERHLGSWSERQLLSILRKSAIRIAGSNYDCPLCGFNASQAPPVADQSTDLQHSSQTKRKREAKRSIRTKLNTYSRSKRTKTHLQNEGRTNEQISDCESISSDESDLELVNSPDAELISPQIKDQQREQLLQHIAHHLKALSFVSLHLNAFCEPPKNGNQGSATGGEQEDLSKVKGPSGVDPELDVDASSPKFTDSPTSAAWAGAAFDDDIKLPQEAPATSNDNKSVNRWVGLSSLDTSVSNPVDTEDGDNAKSALITPLEYIPDQNPTIIQSNSWFQSVELFVQKSISPNKLKDEEIRILLIDHSDDISQSVSKMQQPEESPARPDIIGDLSNNTHRSLMAQMIHRICPHVKLFTANSGAIDQIATMDGAERAAKAIEWAVKKGVQIILMTENLIDSRGNTKESRNLDRQLQQAAAANILLYCAAAESDSHNGGTEPYTHQFDICPISVVGSATEASRVPQSVNPRSVHYLFPGAVAAGVDDPKDNSVATAVAAGFAGLILWCFAYQHPRTAKNDCKGPNADEMHKIFKALQKNGSKWVDVTTLLKTDGSATIQDIVDYYSRARGNRSGRGRRGISPVA